MAWAKPACKKHPTYKAIHKPRVLCEDCWFLWIVKHVLAGRK